MEAKLWCRFYDRNVPPTLRYPRYPVQQMLHISAAMLPHKAATNLYGSELTFRQLRDQTLRLADALIRLGVKKEIASVWPCSTVRSSSSPNLPFFRQAASSST